MVSRRGRRRVDGGNALQKRVSGPPSSARGPAVSRETPDVWFRIRALPTIRAQGFTRRLPGETTTGRISRPIHSTSRHHPPAPGSARPVPAPSQAGSACRVSSRADGLGRRQSGRRLRGRARARCCHRAATSSAPTAPACPKVTCGGRRLCRCPHRSECRARTPVTAAAAGIVAVVRRPGGHRSSFGPAHRRSDVTRWRRDDLGLRVRGDVGLSPGLGGGDALERTQEDPVDPTMSHQALAHESQRGQLGSRPAVPIQHRFSAHDGHPVRC